MPVEKSSSLSSKIAIIWTNARLKDVDTLSVSKNCNDDDFPENATVTFNQANNNEIPFGDCCKNSINSLEDCFAKTKRLNVFQKTRNRYLRRKYLLFNREWVELVYY